MKKLSIISILVLFAGCSRTYYENVIGYNEKGQTLVRVCDSTVGVLDNLEANCKIELRDYGRISGVANTVNSISDDER